MVIYSSMEYYLAVQKSGVLIHSKMWMNLENRKKTDTKGHMFYDSNYMNYVE